ncbi:hypothetical protein Tco_0648734 [Tanacetum coccineum]
MSESAKRHEENSNLIKEIRASTDAAIQNQGASIKTLEIQIGQISNSSGNLKGLSAEEAWETIEDCAQCDKQWNNPTSTISDQTIRNLKDHLVGNEVVRVKIHKCLSWLDAYHKPIGDLDMMEDKMIEDDWELGFKEVSFLVRGLNLPIRPKEVEKVRIKDSHHLEHIFQQVFQHMAPLHHNGVKFLIKNEEEIFTDAGDGVRIYPDGIAPPAIKTYDYIITLIISLLLSLYLMRRSLKVLRKFNWIILGGRFNQLSHVSSPLLSKLGEY